MKRALALLAIAASLVVAFAAAEESRPLEVQIYIDQETGLAVLNARALHAILESHDQLRRENQRLKQEKCI